MSEHRVDVAWERGARPFDTSYVRDHEWRFEGGAVVAASSAPSLMGNPERVDPESAFVAAISSCHMMWFLFLAARDGFVVDGYRDAVVGFLERDPSGVTWMTRVELDPEVTFADGGGPDADGLRDLHARSHERCFIASSVRTEISLPSQRAGGAGDAGR